MEGSTISLGFQYTFEIRIEDYDGSWVLTKVVVYALGYTQALENLQKSGFNLEGVKFLGEGK